MSYRVFITERADDDTQTAASGWANRNFFEFQLDPYVLSSVLYPLSSSLYLKTFLCNAPGTSRT